VSNSARESREFCLSRGRHVGSIDRQISGRSAISSRRYVDSTSSRYQPDDLRVVDPLHGRQSGGSRERYVPDATAIVRSSGYSIVDVAPRRFAVTRRLSTGAMLRIRTFPYLEFRGERKRERERERERKRENERFTRRCNSFDTSMRLSCTRACCMCASMCARAIMCGYVCEIYFCAHTYTYMPEIISLHCR